ncbi:MAG: hypothetical protein HY800_06895, partial [Ignavibacteriales bacterium]|nr:hypothetical protein [Ignavibacteriales bacterium]
MNKLFTVIFVSFLAFVFITIAGTQALGQTNTASAGTTWEGATWSLGHVPLASEDAVINSGINLTINSNAVCGSLTIGNATVSATTLTINAGFSLTISGTTGNLTINPSNVNAAMTLAVGTNVLTVAGTPSLSATNVQTISVSTGSISFTNAAGFTWSAGTLTIAGAGSISVTELLTQTGGTIQNITAAGTINFDGGYSKSGGTFTTLAAGTINFGNNFTVSTVPLTLNATSNAVFTGNSTITPTAAITFGNVQINSGVTVTVTGNITVSGNWTNNGGALNSVSDIVTFSGTAGTIGGTASTT